MTWAPLFCIESHEEQIKTLLKQSEIKKERLRFIDWFNDVFESCDLVASVHVFFMSLFEMGGGLVIEWQQSVWDYARKRSGSYKSGPHIRTCPSLSFWITVNITGNIQMYWSFLKSIMCIFPFCWTRFWQNHWGWTSSLSNLGKQGSLKFNTQEGDNLAIQPNLDMYWISSIQL